MNQYQTYLIGLVTCTHKVVCGIVEMPSAFQKLFTILN